MGQLVDGVWREEKVTKEDESGKFIRQQTQFRNWIGKGDFIAEPNRYHLYISYACPWAHRTHIYRQLKGLETLIGLSVVENYMGKEGWTLAQGADLINHKTFLRDVYTKAEKHYTGRVSVPVLWDKKQETIVSNESSEIIRMFNTAFDKITGNQEDYYPESLRSEIDEINSYVYTNINNGVYKVGFAKTQRAYDEAVTDLFKALDVINERLAGQQYLVGDRITEADWRIFPTLIRFDPVYVVHFKCSCQRIYDYPHLSAYLKRLYDHPQIAETVKLQAIKEHYYTSHTFINPHGIIACGPRF